MFHAGSADQWLEVMDSINLGKMPPDDQTRPEPVCHLSHFLWSTTPDDELFQLAKEGKLSDAAVLSGQVDRLLADPKCREFVENFGASGLA